MTQRAQQIMALLTITLALFVGTTFESTPIVMLATALACVIVYAQRNRPRERVQRRWWVRWSVRALVSLLMLGMAVLTAAWRVGNQLGENFNFVYVGIEVVAHVCLFVILLTWILRPHQGHVAMLPCGLVVVLLCAAAGGGSLSLAGQTSIALAAAVGFTVASQIILGVRRGTRGELFAVAEHDGKTGERSESGAWIGPVSSLLTLSVLTMVTTTIANATNVVLPTIQERLQEQLEATFDPNDEELRIGGTRYVSGSRLGSIREHMVGSPQDVALRIYCDVTPGYMRGNVFDIYSRRRWYSAAHEAVIGVNFASMGDRIIAPSGPAQISLEEGSPLRRHRFQLAGDTADRTINLEIHNDPLKGRTVFLPLTARWIEAVSGGLALSSHQIVQAGGVDVGHAYVVGVGFNGVAESMATDRREVLLMVPQRLAQVTAPMVAEVCQGQTTARGKAEAISRFFQQNFIYSLNDIRTPRDIDPVANFLETRHPAHCEYFATATVILLRQAGIPARYVTGYVADEFSDDLEYWVARNRDAHAWAEAYDEKTGQWFAVESTPGRTYQTVSDKDQTTNDAGLFGGLGRDEGSDDGSWLGWVLGWIGSFRVTDPLFVIFRIAQWPLFFFLVFYLWSRRYRSVREGEAAVDFQSRKMLKRVDRRLRRYALVRRPSETLYQFADRIDQRVADAAQPIKEDVRLSMVTAAQWYRNFATARYQGQMPTPLA